MSDSGGVWGAPARRAPAAYAAAGRRAVRVTLAAAAGFYLFRYGLGQPVAATYALFAAVAVGGLSRIPGTGRQRAATVVRALPVCWLLVVVGTYLSVRTWCAVAGMLLIGFALAFAAVGGPRPAGAAPGLQLLYILPSFPPYDPGSLSERLIGTTAGLLLFVAVEALVLPEPAPPSYRARAADAALTAARTAHVLTTPPYALTADGLRAAQRAGQELRLLTVPEAERPAGPSARDRALTHTGLATRTLLGRLALLPPAPRTPPPPQVTAVLAAVADLARATAACLRGGPSPVTPYARLSTVRARLSALSAGLPVPAGAAPASPAYSPAMLRRHAAVLEIADAALALGTAADLATHGRHRSITAAPGRFWYASLRSPALWWHRIQGHAGQRSVFFQNAVRLALALTAARLVAGLDTLPHGFWAMLATLTLTRTTVDETWSTVRTALTGTFVGALVTAAVLILLGTDTGWYAAVLPLWMLFAFTVGPVRGVGWAQGLFTVLVALVFAQLSPPTWHLAEVRMLDVLIGSAIGTVFGLLAWPRGAHDELRRTAAELLRRAAETAVATAAAVADTRPAEEATAAAGPTGSAPPAVPGHHSLQHAVILAESAYAQYQSEPTPFGGAARGAAPRQVDWQATLIAGHHALWGSARLLEPPQPRLGPVASASVAALGERVAGRMLLASAALDPGDDTPTAVLRPLDPALAELAVEPPDAPRLYYATESWLGSLLTDLTHIARAHDRPAEPGTPDPPGASRPPHV
ncbi:FUSC family protein [Streptomyces sp. NBC_00083]|uniref:FUSC family protein n=1 Tax=Streptomyces sp. NBC_00083 TaxID=2975647 RepID=UPI00225938E4|nr:FUSC family protein [Streptomyces sp. NBC_00083]MCX5384623.1 FUSC family protein [Streptomyces sp. NBC_00083]